jgi:hypothetical protein
MSSELYGRCTQQIDAVTVVRLSYAPYYRGNAYALTEIGNRFPTAVVPLVVVDAHCFRVLTIRDVATRACPAALLPGSRRNPPRIPAKLLSYGVRACNATYSSYAGHAVNRPTLLHWCRCAWRLASGSAGPLWELLGCAFRYWWAASAGILCLPGLAYCEPCWDGCCVPCCHCGQILWLLYCAYCAVLA